MTMNRLPAGFRDLGADEIASVAGGFDKPGKYYWDANHNGVFDEGEKTVFIEPHLDPLDPSGYPEWYDGYSIYDATYFDDSGGMGGPLTIAPEDCRDRQALEAQHDINNHSGHNTHEFGILI